MGRAPCCSKVGLHRGPWSPREDTLLTNYIQSHGEGNWRSLPKKAGLLRCGKSCRLRWLNYLRPDIKRGNISSDEDDLIIRLHILLGNRWSLIAGRLPGRTDNEIKNYWNTHLSKKLRAQGIDPETHKQLQNGRGSDIDDQTDHTSNSKKHKLRKRKAATQTMTNDNHNDDTTKKHQAKNKNSINVYGQDYNLRNHVVHLPKPVRVSSFSVLPRNDSFMSIITSDQPTGGGGDQQIINIQNDNNNYGNTQASKDGTEFFIGENNNNNDDDHQGLSTGDTDYNIMTSDGSDDNLHLGFDDDDDHYKLICTDHYQDHDLFGDDHNFNKMYDEYLQVLKTSTSTADNGDNNSTDDQNDQLLQLDSFDDSIFLV